MVLKFPIEVSYVKLFIKCADGQRDQSFVFLLSELDCVLRLTSNNICLHGTVAFYQSSQSTIWISQFSDIIQDNSGHNIRGDSEEGGQSNTNTLHNELHSLRIFLTAGESEPGASLSGRDWSGGPPAGPRHRGGGQPGGAVVGVARVPRVEQQDEIPQVEDNIHRPY